MKRWLVRLAVLALIVAAGAGVAGWMLYSRTQEPFRGYTAGEQFVEVTQGQGSRAIGRRLVETGVVRDELTFRVALLLSGRARELKAGEYRFDQPMTAIEVIDRIAKGDVYKRLLTFAEGLTITEMAEVFDERGFGSAADFVRAAGDPSPIRDLDPAAPDLEGYLFPETYSLPRTASAAEVVKQMVGFFRDRFDAELRAKSAAEGLSIREVVTLASLVEKETAEPSERPLVAAVYRNRLEKHMPMQADPTVIYAMQKAGKYNGNIRRDDLQIDSPYNTYRYPGLPPGPIASPGLAALQAAVRPADVKYLYFVSRNDGTHAFAETLTEHNRNVATFQVRYFRRNGNRPPASSRPQP
jgi:UPF0755 protein